MDLAHQPLFRLLAAIIVLLITDMNPVYGLAALVVWTAWVYLSFSKFFVSKQ
jgi:hypothetical protein